MSKLPPPNVKRMKIEGAVILKRKSAWVKRYAKVENCIFSYKNSANDKSSKYEIDLRTAKVMLGQHDNNSPYIYI